MHDWQLNDIDKQLIKLAFREDLGLPFQDVTVDTLFKDNNTIKTAFIISKHHEPVVISGIPLISELLSLFHISMNIKSRYHDGDILHPGETMLTITGPAHTLLKAERTILNFLQRMCAVATITKKFTDKIMHTKTKVLDTRKTIPGFRHLDKYAVRCGGGVNHRMGLFDAIMIKDTHIDALGGISKAINTLPDDILKHCPVIIEVRDKDELQVVLTEGLQKTTRVLLDNMTELQLKECVLLCENKIPTEASGNIDLDNIVSIAETGVDFVSIGKITHSAGNVNLSMKCEL